MTDYLSVSTPIESYGSYFELFFDVGSLFVLLYAVLLPLIGVGYFKDRVFGVWTFLLLVGGLGCLVVPFAALFLWARWMLMLVYPFTFFAANGLASLRRVSKGYLLCRLHLTRLRIAHVGYTIFSVYISPIPLQKSAWASARPDASGQYRCTL